MSEGQLGTIISWKVPKEVSVDQLREALLTAGIDPALAGDLAPRHALKRAFKEMKKNRVIRELRKDGEKLIFQFTREELTKDEAFYRKEAMLVLDLETGLVKCSDYSLQEKARELLAEHLAKRLTSDLSRLVQRLYDKKKAELIPIREQGGAYFVPDQHSDLVDATRKLLDAIGGSLLTFSIRLGVADTADSVAASFSDYLLGNINEFRDSCANVTSDSRKNVVASRVARIGELRQSLEANKAILGTYVAAITAEIDKSEEVLIAALTIAPTPDASVEDEKKVSDNQLALV